MNFHLVILASWASSMALGQDQGGGLSALLVFCQFCAAWVGVRLLFVVVVVVVVVAWTNLTDFVEHPTRPCQAFVTVGLEVWAAGRVATSKEKNCEKEHHGHGRPTCEKIDFAMAAVSLVFYGHWP